MTFRPVRAGVALLLASFTLAALGSAPVSARRHGPSTGLSAIDFAKVPPDFTFDLGSGPQRLSAAFGKPIVLNFWATWCSPCVEELGVFEKLEATYGSAATLITLSKEPSGTARDFIKEHSPVALPVVEDQGGKVFAAYSVREVPVTIVLGRDGTVAHVSVGELDWAELQQAVDAALASP